MNENVLLRRDHNLDLLKSSSHPNTQSFLEINLEKNLLPCVTKPTRITHTSATLIDNILISHPLQKSFDSGIIIDDMSDHLPCYIEITGFMEANLEPIKIIMRDLDEKAIKNIKCEMDQTDWDSLLRPVSANIGFEIFHNKLISVIDTHAPERERTIKPNFVIKEPWMTPGLRKCDKKQKNLYKRHILTSKSTESELQYKEYRTVLGRVKRYCKTNYYKESCNEFRSNTKKLWQLINKAIQKEPNKTNLIDCLTIDNVKQYSSTVITNELAKYFSSVGETYSDNIKSATRGIKSYLETITRCNQSLFLGPTNELEISKILGSMLNKTFSGYDDICNTLLKKLEHSVVIPMTIVFKKSFEDGKFPHSMKTAEVVPLHKGKARDLSTNYRPISLLFTISKVLEKIMYSRTYNFLTDTDQIFASQYGFRKNHSCTNAISELLSEFVKGTDNGHKTVAVYSTSLRRLTP